MGKLGELPNTYSLCFGFVLLKQRKLALMYLVATFSKSPPIELGIVRAAKENRLAGPKYQFRATYPTCHGSVEFYSVQKMKQSNWSHRFPYHKERNLSMVVTSSNIPRRATFIRHVILSKCHNQGQK